MEREREREGGGQRERERDRETERQRERGRGRFSLFIAKGERSQGHRSAERQVKADRQEIPLLLPVIPVQGSGAGVT